MPETPASARPQPEHSSGGGVAPVAHRIAVLTSQSETTQPPPLLGKADASPYAMLLASGGGGVEAFLADGAAASAHSASLVLADGSNVLGFAELGPEEQFGVESSACAAQLPVLTLCEQVCERRGVITAKRT